MSRRKRKEHCNKYRRNRLLKTPGDPHLTLVQNSQDTMPSQRPRQVTIQARNRNQELLLEYLEDYDIDIVFAVGPAGTGKTLISTLAGIRELKNREVNKFVVTRPAVGAGDEEHGFLPGTIQEKMAPWTRPIFDIFEEYYTTEQIEYMLKDHKIEISPLAFMRGRTFKHSWVIADEMQNSTESQMKMLLTRIGEGSKLVITGDLAQHDRGSKTNGLSDFVQRLERQHSSRIRVVYFDRGDVERHPVVDEVLRLYGDE